MRQLRTIKKKHGGRDTSGRVAVRHKGGEHKRFLRSIDFKRDKHGVVGRVVAIEYDPNRSVDIVLIQYADGEKRYMLRPQGLVVGDTVVAGAAVELKIGNALPLAVMPVGTVVHNVELTSGRGGCFGRSAGTSIYLLAKEGGYAHLKMPSGEIRKVRREGYATVGQLSNIEWKNRVIGTAGKNRRMGIRPTVRGVAQNPRSHPHGGGEGRSGIGMSTPKTYAGRKAVGRTRRKHKYSDTHILQRRRK